MSSRSTFLVLVGLIAFSGFSRGEIAEPSAPTDATADASAAPNPEGQATADRPPAATPNENTDSPEKTEAASDAGGAGAAPSPNPNSDTVATPNPETPPEPVLTPEEKAKQAAENAQKRSGIGKLVAKLTGKNGQSVRIGILKPLDYTTLNFADLASKVAIESIKRYGDFNLIPFEENLAALTLEEFRKVVVKRNMDIVIVIVLKPTNFDLFLFDRRTPYNIYAHSETLPEPVQYQLTKEVVEEYTKVIVRRILYSYLQDQYYELPREEVKPFLTSEIPRWVASGRNLRVINRELLSHFYGSVSVGAALAVGQGEAWNSNLVGLQLGFRLLNQVYGEVAASFFAYNAFQAGFKYMITDRDNPFKFTLGLGAAKVSNVHTLNFDQHFTQGLGSTYLVPSASLIFPIVDIHFKLETQLLINGGRFIYTVMPGLFLMF